MYYQVNCNDYNDSLYHHGVKGMRWGVRHDRSKNHGWSFGNKVKKIVHEINPKTQRQKTKIEKERMDIYRKSKYAKKTTDYLIKSEQYQKKGDNINDKLGKKYGAKLNEDTAGKTKDWKQMSDYYKLATDYNNKAWVIQDKGMKYANSVIVKKYGEKYDEDRLLEEQRKNDEKLKKLGIVSVAGLITLHAIDHYISKKTEAQ